MQTYVWTNKSIAQVYEPLLSSCVPGTASVRTPLTSLSQVVVYHPRVMGPWYTCKDINFCYFTKLLWKTRIALFETMHSMDPYYRALSMTSWSVAKSPAGGSAISPATVPSESAGGSDRKLGRSARGRRESSTLFRRRAVRSVTNHCCRHLDTLHKHNLT